MRGVVWCALGALLTGAFSGCLDDGSSLTLDRPLWASGFSFSYETRGEYENVEKHVGGDESGEDTEKGTWGPMISQMQVLNTTMRNGDVPMYVSAIKQYEEGQEQVSMSYAGMPVAHLRAIRQRDLSWVPMEYAYTGECPQWTGDERPDVSQCDLLINGVSFGEDPEDTYLQFPLRKGESWSHKTDDGEIDTMEWLVTAKVGSPTNVDLKLGRVRALPVDFSFEAINLDEVIREAIAEDEELDSLNVEIQQHMKVYYSEDYQTVVKSESQRSMLFRAEGQEDGERFVIEGRYDGRFEEVLTGARLVAMPERDLDYISQVVWGKIPIEDPSGQARKAAGYTLEVVPSATVVNAAESPQLTFEAKIIGDEAGFAGHKATWRILDYFGNEAASGEGLKGSFQVDKPGHYTIEFETRDATDQVAAGASAFVVANYELTVGAQCPLIVVDPIFIESPLGRCNEVTIPVQPGVQSIRVGAWVGSPVAVIHDGTLRLDDGADNEWTDSTGQQGQYEIVVDDDLNDVSFETPWTLRLDQLYGLDEQVTYWVFLQYGVDPEATPEIVEPVGVGASLPRSTLRWI